MYWGALKLLSVNEWHVWSGYVVCWTAYDRTAPDSRKYLMGGNHTYHHSTQNWFYHTPALCTTSMCQDNQRYLPQQE